MKSEMQSFSGKSGFEIGGIAQPIAPPPTRSLVGLGETVPNPVFRISNEGYTIPSVGGDLIQDSGRKAREKRKAAGKISEGKTQTPIPEAKGPSAQPGEHGGGIGSPPKRPREGGSEYGGEKKWEPREHIGLAEAIVDRLDRDIAYLYRFYAAEGVEFQGTTRRTLMIADELLTLQKIDDPRSRPSYKEIADVCITPDLLRQLQAREKDINDAGRDMLDKMLADTAITPDLSEELQGENLEMALERGRARFATVLELQDVHKQNRLMEIQELDPSISSRYPEPVEKISVLIAESKKVAEQHKVTVEEVLRDDRLYAAVARASNPSVQDYILREAPLLGAYSFFPADPELDQTVRDRIQQNRQLILADKVREIWGDEAIDELPSGLRSWLRGEVSHRGLDEIVSSASREIVTSEDKAAAVEGLHGFAQKEPDEIEGIQTVDDFNRVLGNTVRNIHTLVAANEYTEFDPVDGGIYTYDVFVEDEDGGAGDRVKIVSENGYLSFYIAEYRKNTDERLELSKTLGEIEGLSHDPLTNFYDYPPEELKVFARSVYNLVRCHGSVLE